MTWLPTIQETRTFATAANSWPTYMLLGNVSPGKLAACPYCTGKFNELTNLEGGKQWVFSNYCGERWSRNGMQGFRTHINLNKGGGRLVRQSNLFVAGTRTLPSAFDVTARTKHRPAPTHADISESYYLRGLVGNLAREGGLMALGGFAVVCDAGGEADWRIAVAAALASSPPPLLCSAHYTWRAMLIDEIRFAGQQRPSLPAGSGHRPRKRSNTNARTIHVKRTNYWITWKCNLIQNQPHVRNMDSDTTPKLYENGQPDVRSSVCIVISRNRKSCCPGSSYFQYSDNTCVHLGKWDEWLRKSPGIKWDEGLDPRAGRKAGTKRGDVLSSAGSSDEPPTCREGSASSAREMYVPGEAMYGELQRACQLRYTTPPPPPRTEYQHSTAIPSINLSTPRGTELLVSITARINKWLKSLVHFHLTEFSCNEDINYNIQWRTMFAPVVRPKPDTSNVNIYTERRTLRICRRIPRKLLKFPTHIFTPRDNLAWLTAVNLNLENGLHIHGFTRDSHPQPVDRALDTELHVQTNENEKKKVGAFSCLSSQLPMEAGFTITNVFKKEDEKWKNHCSLLTKDVVMGTLKTIAAFLLNLYLGMSEMYCCHPAICPLSPPPPTDSLPTCIDMTRMSGQRDEYRNGRLTASHLTLPKWNNPDSIRACINTASVRNRGFGELRRWLAARKDRIAELQLTDLHGYLYGHGHSCGRRYGPFLERFSSATDRLCLLLMQTSLENYTNGTTPRQSWSSAGMQGQEETGDPADQRHCTTRLPHAQIPGATPPGIEPGSPRWEASSLTTTPPRGSYWLESPLRARHNSSAFSLSDRLAAMTPALYVIPITPWRNNEDEGVLHVCMTCNTLYHVSFRESERERERERESARERERETSTGGTRELFQQMERAQLLSRARCHSINHASSFVHQQASSARHDLNSNVRTLGATVKEVAMRADRRCALQIATCLCARERRVEGLALFPHEKGRERGRIFGNCREEEKGTKLLEGFRRTILETARKHARGWRMELKAVPENDSRNSLCRPVNGATNIKQPPDIGQRNTGSDAFRHRGSEPRIYGDGYAHSLFQVRIDLKANNTLQTRPVECFKDAQQIRSIIPKRCILQYTHQIATKFLEVLDTDDDRATALCRAESLHDKKSSANWQTVVCRGVLQDELATPRTSGCGVPPGNDQTCP
ncbi:hypothetical protein PR048_029204 [Dryococelus australis]|uniref:Uncharacterized protein n=1 Tax=Dryococelus australis TaxID=614101 RepID=A0ABQ9GCQ6_9NEOP|nr:hypothetical protein PR048_029204 [Dryococelus australis]